MISTVMAKNLLYRFSRLVSILILWSVVCSYPCTLPPSFLYSRQARHGSLSSENASRRTVWLGDPPPLSNDPTGGCQIIFQFTFGKVTQEVFWISNPDFQFHSVPFVLTRCPENIFIDFWRDHRKHKSWIQSTL